MHRVKDSAIVLLSSAYEIHPIKKNEDLFADS